MLKKKIVMLVVSVGALAALVIPASVSAAVLTSEDHPGVPIEQGGQITITGPTLKTTTPLGTIECNEVNLFGEIDSVNGDTTKGHGTGGEVNGCKFQPGGQPETVEEVNVENIVFEGMEVTVEFSYVTEFPAGGGTIRCEFATPEPSHLEMTTGTDIAHVAILLESEACGESEIHGETTWETEDGTPIIFSEG